MEYDEVQWETLDMVCALVGLIESLLADLDPDDPGLEPLEGWWFSRALLDAARLGSPAIDAVAERFTLIACHRPQDHNHLVEGAFDVLDATVCTLTPDHPRAARRVTAALRHLREDGPSWPGFRLR